MKAKKVLFSRITKDEWQNPIWKETEVLAAMEEYAEQAFNAAKEGRIEKVPVVIDQDWKS